MKTPTIIFFATAIVLLAASCGNRAKETTIYGQVRTYGTQEAIRHEPVKVQILEEVRVDGPFGNWGYTEIASTWADQNNNFTLTAGLRNDGTKYCLAVAPETVKTGQGYIAPSFSNIDRPERLITKVGGTHNMNYYLTALGWVEFHFISENPQPGDVFSYNLGGGAYEVFYGHVDVYRKWDFGGNLEHRVSLELKRNGIWSNWQEHIFVPAFDTIEYQIKF